MFVLVLTWIQVKQDLLRLQLMRRMSKTREAERFRREGLSLSFVFLLVALLVYQNWAHVSEVMDNLYST